MGPLSLFRHRRASRPGCRENASHSRLRRQPTALKFHITSLRRSRFRQLAVVPVKATLVESDQNQRANLPGQHLSGTGIQFAGADCIARGGDNQLAQHIREIVRFPQQFFRDEASNGRRLRLFGRGRNKRELKPAKRLSRFRKRLEESFRTGDLTCENSHHSRHQPQQRF